LTREGLVRNHIKPALGSKKLTKVNPDDLKKFYRDRLASGLAPSTVKLLHTILNKVLKQAERSKTIRSNPASEVRPPKVPTQEMNVLTPEQVKHLLDVVRGERLECVFVLAATCALRIGEALSLRYEDLDLGKGTLLVRRTLWRGKTYKPKTDKSRRTLKLPKIALEALRRHHKHNGSPDVGWRFSTKHDNPVTAANFHTWGCKPALCRADLPQSTTYHSLRHGAASLMLALVASTATHNNQSSHAVFSLSMTLGYVVCSTDGPYQNMARFVLLL
jgi:integrase